jgi:integrase/recombinase XerD
MLAEYFESHSRIQTLLDCPAGHLVEGFAQELYKAGYAQLTARRHLRSAEHLVYWIARRGMSVTGLTERFVKEFSNHLNRCRCTRYGHTHRLELENGVRLFISRLLKNSL